MSDTLPQSVLLGTNVPDLPELLRTERQGKALMVVTCIQAKRMSSLIQHKGRLQKTYLQLLW